MTAALEFHSVSKTFSKRRKSVQALRDVSFSISEGEVFGFVGPNGAGKSTTIKIMLDVINDYQGDVTLYGVNAREAKARRGIAYVPESPAIYEQFTPLEVLKMALNMYGIKKPDNEHTCHQWLERFSVGHVANRRMRQLSKGTVQRVALAHAMVVAPSLLVLDEPLSGLDPVGRKDVIDILSEYKADGGAIFFTSHVLHDVERIADRFGFINKGELITTRSPKELLSEHNDQLIVRFQSSTPISDQARETRKGEYELNIDQAQLSEWLCQLERTNGHILSIHPAISLETVFFQMLNQEKEENNATSNPA